MQRSCLISVIVPSYNRSAALATCLEAFARQEHARQPFEVIVVNDGGVSPGDVVTLFERRLNLTLVDAVHAGPAAARNAGAARAIGDYLAFVDDDCAVSPDWLSRLETRIAERPLDAIGGKTINMLADSVYSSASQMLVDHLYERSNSMSAHPSFFASNNLTVPRAGFSLMEGFDAAYPRAAGEDRDFCDRWLQRGLGMTYASEVVVYHAHALTLRSFWAQHFNYGRAAFTVRRTRARRDRRRLTIEPLTFYAGLLTRPFNARSSRAPLLCAALALSQIANTAGFFWQAGFGDNAQRLSLSEWGESNPGARK